MSVANREARPVIFGLEGTALTAEEAAFFRETRPWGIILFARNIETREQLRALTDDLREKSGNAHLPIFIDQEGGRVARLKPPLVRAYPPARAYAELFAQNPEAGTEAAHLGAMLLAHDLHELGITANCAPCLDLGLAGMSDVIGDRAYGDNGESIIQLGGAFYEGLRAGGVVPVIKHLPGHGRAKVDSHHALPDVDTDLNTLAATDFVPFRALNGALMGMTAHITYSALDGAHVSTLSRVVVGDIIRDRIGFDGLLMTDDLSMKALSGDFAERTEKALAAGCDIILHCNGDRDEMAAIAGALPQNMSGKTAERAARVEAEIAGLSSRVDEKTQKRWGELVGHVFPEAQNTV
ncbi:MAG: beta-N-acetylhexosaminidase [Parvibaculales bacterium]